MPLTVYHEGVTFDVVLASTDRAKLLKGAKAALEIALEAAPEAGTMSEAVVDDIVAVLPPLLQSLEALSFVARHLNPPDFGRVMQAAGTPDRDLQAVHDRLVDWPGEFAEIRTGLQAASDAALAAFQGLRAVEQGQGDLVAVFRALRYLPRAQEALYPLAVKFPPVSSFFTDPALRDDDGAGWRGLKRPRNRTPASFTITTRPAAAAAIRCMCRNITRPTAPGRW